MENELVAELESALQAVVRRAPQPAGGPESAAAPSAAQSTQVGASDSGLHISNARLPDSTADAEARQPSSPRLRSAQAAKPSRALSWELDAPVEDHLPSTRQPGRHGIAPRAALCVAGLLGLAATGAVALTSFAGPGDSRPASQAEETSTANKLAASGAVAFNEAAQAPDAAALPREEATPAGGPVASVGDEPGASGVTLLRPVGKTSTAATDSPAAEVSSLQDELSAEQAGAPDTKLPDRLVGTPAPAQVAQVQEQPEFSTSVHEPASQPAESAVRLTPPADDPVAAPNPPSFGAAIPEPATPAPSGGEALIAGADPQSVEAAPESLEAAEAALTGASPELSAAMPETSGADTQQMQTDLAAAGSDGAAESARAAPVTSAVNLRAGPDNDAAVVTVIPAGSQVNVIGCEYWCEVVFAGERGWIYKSFVSGADS